MSLPVKPIYLLADSQLLFWKPEEGPSLLERVRADLHTKKPKAAYLGASNGDRPEFFELFRGAVEGADITDCRHVPAEPSDDDLEFLDEAHLVLLAGGDVRQGWRAFKKSGVKQKIIERYYGGGVLMGVSAGAVQLGLYAWRQDEKGNYKIFETLKLVPAFVDVHAEPDWWRLQKALGRTDEKVRGLGIPSGAGAVLYPDLTLEPVRRSLVEIFHDEDGNLHQSLLFPPEESAEEDESTVEAPPVMRLPKQDEVFDALPGETAAEEVLDLSADDYNVDDASDA